MNPRTMATPETETTSPSGSLLDKLLSNRPLIYGVIGVVAVILVAYVAVAVMQRAQRQQADRAWAEVHAAMRQLRDAAQSQGVVFPEGTAEYFQALDPELQVRVFGGVLESVRGTVAEPTVLFYLANAHLAGRQVDQAERRLAELESRYGDHYLVSADASYVSQSLVDAFRMQLEREREFLAANPDFLTGSPKSDDDGSEEGTATDGE